MVTKLKKIKCFGRTWIIDERLNELRDVENPSEIIRSNDSWFSAKEYAKYVNKPEPKVITVDEWKEISQVKEIRESLGLEDAEWFEVASSIYGVKYDFISGSPGYVGDVFVLLGDALGYCPLILTRDYKTKKLEVIKLEHY